MGRVKGIKHEEISRRNTKFDMTEGNRAGIVGQLDKK